MAKNRKEVQQLGFWDDEVKQLDHDEIVLWAYQNAELVLQAWLSVQTNWKKWESRAWLKSEIRCERFDLADLPSPPARLPFPQIVKKEIERPLIKKTGYNAATERYLGYADLVISYYMPDEVCWDSHDQEWHVTARTGMLLVEAKTVMPTLGDLMRQINLYRCVIDDVVVVSPDGQWADILNEQGVLFVNYPRIVA